jgi:hypothetical protein
MVDGSETEIAYDPSSHLMQRLNAYQQRCYRRKFSKIQKELIRAAFEAGREYEKSLQRALIEDAFR